jgi:xanthine dehydrogenase YagR molybdenum-binding subunit
MYGLPNIGAPVARLDGRLKVMGAARYGSDMSGVNVAYAYLATSRIARGRIVSIDDRKTRSVRGVLEVLTHDSVGDAVQTGTYFSKGGYVSSTIRPLASTNILHAGQIVAVVLAESFEAAREGAHALDIDYSEEKPAAGFDSVGSEVVLAKIASPEHDDPHVGDADEAFASAEVKVNGTL